MSLDWWPKQVVDIEEYEDYGDGHWAQARYLAHGLEDVLWTNDFSEALNFLKQEVGSPHQIPDDE